LTVFEEKLKKIEALTGRMNFAGGNGHNQWPQNDLLSVA
jgi:hypothetical protein